MTSIIDDRTDAQIVEMLSTETMQAAIGKAIPSLDESEIALIGNSLDKAKDQFANPQSDYLHGSAEIFQLLHRIDQPMQCNFGMLEIVSAISAPYMDISDTRCAAIVRDQKSLLSEHAINIIVDHAAGDHDFRSARDLHAKAKKRDHNLQSPAYVKAAIVNFLISQTSPLDAENIINEMPPLTAVSYTHLTLPTILRV